MDNSELVEIGTQIHVAREQAGLSLEQLADRARTEPETLKRIELGELPFNILVVQRLQTALGVLTGHRWDVDVEVVVGSVGELLQMVPRAERAAAVQEIREVIRRASTPAPII